MKLYLKVGDLITSRFDGRKHQVKKINKTKVYYSENPDGSGVIHSDIYSVILECFEVEAEKPKELKTQGKTESKPLFLILQLLYFDPIISGEKTIEYREASPHNISRLCTKDKSGKITGFRNHKTVIFQAGYNKNAKRLTVEVRKMTYDGDFIEIHLGKVLDKNY